MEIWICRAVLCDAGQEAWELLLCVWVSRLCDSVPNKRPAVHAYIGKKGQPALSAVDGATYYANVFKTEVQCPHLGIEGLLLPRATLLIYGCLALACWCLCFVACPYFPFLCFFQRRSLITGLLFPPFAVFPAPVKIDATEKLLFKHAQVQFSRCHDLCMKNFE